MTPLTPLNTAQIIPLHIIQIYWNVVDMNGENGWKADSEIKRIYFREPVSKSIEGLGGLSFQTISYEVVKQFKNKNYIQAAISMNFMITSIGADIDKENYDCMLICADELQRHVNLVTEKHNYLHIDVSVNSETQFDPTPPDRLGDARQN